jgi:hypothetical protein
MSTQKARVSPDALFTVEHLQSFRAIVESGTPLARNTVLRLIENAHAHLVAALPEVTSVEERDQLPVGTIARSAHALVAVKSANGWLVAGYSKEFRILDLPFTVLDRPGVDE